MQPRVFLQLVTFGLSLSEQIAAGGVRVPRRSTHSLNAAPSSNIFATHPPVTFELLDDGATTEQAIAPAERRR